VFRLGVEQVVDLVVDVFVYRYDDSVGHEEAEQRSGNRDDDCEDRRILMESGCHSDEFRVSFRSSDEYRVGWYGEEYSY